ncbi:hypothetical protein [Nakamurella aerolata]|uniref:Uncharacterized protein n=1 Tax=Nakamurella aerolata TaxID=1656892 RepID=A0A849AE35_9ACTN|nr:hypothetical protein [Nakamurella aerolata]NNG37448.1 hypothetical protein [Nakamurella aerolata]
MTTLTAAERAAFATAYTKTLINAWSDEAFADRLQQRPAETLTAAGIAVPDGTTVALQRVAAAEPVDGEPTGVQAQLAAYERSAATGHFVFYLPDAPQIDRAELAESELSSVAAGGIWDPYCCSCCPSCCSASGSG